MVSRQKIVVGERDVRAGAPQGVHASIQRKGIAVALVRSNENQGRLRRLGAFSAYLHTPLYITTVLRFITCAAVGAKRMSSGHNGIACNTHTRLPGETLSGSH